MLCLLMYVSRLPAAQADQPHLAGWHLTQKQDDAGEYEAYILPEAIKIYSTRSQWYLISKAPAWTANFFRRDEKTIFTMPLSKFRSMMIANPYAPPEGRARTENARSLASDEQEDPKLRKIGTGTMAGLPFDEYSGLGRNRYVVLKTAAIKADPKCAEVIARLSGIPHAVHMRNIPLGYRVVVPVARQSKTQRQLMKDQMELSLAVEDLRSGEQIKLTTLKSERQNLSMNDFTIPLDYRRVSDLIEVTYSKNMKSNLTEALDQFGFRSYEIPSGGHHAPVGKSDLKNSDHH